MEIHKPKPFHDWHEFLSEVLIIILGVSIALAAEQAIEALHWHHKIEMIEDAMRAELVGDDLPQAYARLAIEPCLIKQLDGLQALVKPGADGARFHELARDYTPPKRTWDNYAQELAQQSDLSAHMSADRLAAWNSAYTLIPMIRPIADRETAARHRLVYARYAGRKLTSTDADELSDTIDDLREANRGTVGAGKVMLRSAQLQLKQTLPQDVANRILKEAHATYGNCVVKPNWDELPGNDVQVNTRASYRRLLNY